MSKNSRPRRGSLQYYPRKRAAKFIHKVNWSPVSSQEKGPLGFITYKVGMATAIVTDETDKSLTQKKRIAVPVTILEAPNMKVFSIRFYKHGKPIKDLIVSNDKELKKKLKTPKSPISSADLEKKIPEGYDDVHLIAYSLPKTTSVKKTPDLVELSISSPTPQEKLEVAKSFIGKEIPVSDFVNMLDKESQLIDVRGVTKGKGFSGPVKRFGITLRFHKSEKGVRKVGSIAPWHPARVTFRTPMAGQLGLFSRILFNSKLIKTGTIAEENINPSNGFKNYGNVKTSYIVIKGSVPGPAKRAVIITPALRPTKFRSKRKLNFLELVTK